MKNGSGCHTRSISPQQKKEEQMVGNNEVFNYYADQETKMLHSAIILIGSILGAALLCLLAWLVGGR